MALDLRDFFEPARAAILAGEPVRRYDGPFDRDHKELIRSAGNQFRWARDHSLARLDG